MWLKSVERGESGGRLGSPRQNFWPLPKRAAGSASIYMMYLYICIFYDDHLKK